MKPIKSMTPKELRDEAERRVIEIRGSNDVPAFESCVKAEMAMMKQSGK